MKKRLGIYLLAVVMLLGIVAMPVAGSAQEELRGATSLSILASAVPVEIYDAPGAEPVFVYDEAHYELASRVEDGTLDIQIKPRPGIFMKADTIQLFLPMGDYTEIAIEANAGAVTLMPFHANLTAEISAGVFTCYLPKDFANDLAIETTASALEVFIHEEFQDFTIEVVDGELSAVSLPNGVSAGAKVGNGTHTLRFEPAVSSLEISWYGDADSIPSATPPEAAAQ